MLSSRIVSELASRTNNRSYIWPSGDSNVKQLTQNTFVWIACLPFGLSVSSVGHLSFESIVSLRAGALLGLLMNSRSFFVSLESDRSFLIFVSWWIIIVCFSRSRMKYMFRKNEIGPLPVIENLLLILLFSSTITFLLEHASRRSSTYTRI